MIKNEYMGTPTQPTEQDSMLVVLNVLDRELARLDSMDESKIVEGWNLVDWRKRRNAVLHATDVLSKRNKL
jgi:hypothetical protein